MSAVAKASRSQLWLESLGEWSWPGQGARRRKHGAAALGARIPATKRPAFAGSRCAGSWAPEARAARRLIAGTLISLLAIVLALAQSGQLTINGLFGSEAPAAEQEAAASSSARDCAGAAHARRVSKGVSGS